MLKFFFFFQAEDGIRDLYVTGVQTCALPISGRGAADVRTHVPRKRTGGRLLLHGLRTARTWPRVHAPGKEQRCASHVRSEERRVGKECRSRWSSYYLKIKRRI